MTACPRGFERPEPFRFCPDCGAELETRHRELRKTVTVLFSDVVGSTSLGESLDPELLRRVMGRYFEEVRVVLERHGGTLEKFIGDAVVALFGVPTAREDDALRALRSAAEIRERLDVLNDEFERELGIQIGVRTGVHTGEVVVGETDLDGFRASGDAMNVAARLEQSAAANEILIGPADESARRGRDRGRRCRAAHGQGKSGAARGLPSAACAPTCVSVREAGGCPARRSPARARRA